MKLSRLGLVVLALTLALFQFGTALAVEEPQPTLTVMGAGVGDGTMEAFVNYIISCDSQAGVTSGQCSATAPSGSHFEIYAYPGPGSESATPVWLGCDSSPSPELCVVDLFQDTTVTATFNLQPSLTVNAAGIGNGSMTDLLTGGFTIQCESAGGPPVATAPRPLPLARLFSCRRLLPRVPS